MDDIDMKTSKVIILFSRLSDYMLNVFSHWVETSDVELHIIRKTVDEKEAPFEFQNEYPRIYLYNRDEFSYLEMFQKVKMIDPQLVICSGWSDADYLKIVSHYSGKVPTVISMDNQWKNTLKQKIFTFMSPFILKDKFSHIWVPGEPQAIYAKKLGFKDEQILNGFYVANSENFSMDKINPKQTMQKKFVYVGRYVDVKGVKDLWKAFIEIQNKNPNEWELVCIGTGPLYEERMEHVKIKHMGFVQPQDMKNYMKEGGVFVLPSHFEPWGVVIHEFALAGFPMLVSDAVGAASSFVRHEKNGFLFKSNNIIDLKENMLKIINLSESELMSMGKISQKYSQHITKEMWVDTINKVLTNV